MIEYLTQVSDLDMVKNIYLTHFIYTLKDGTQYHICYDVNKTDISFRCVRNNKLRTGVFVSKESLLKQVADLFKFKLVTNVLATTSLITVDNYFKCIS